MLANEIALILKYRIGLKHFFNINLGIGIIKETNFFVWIFDIYPHVFTQILIERAHWMQNLIPHPTNSPDRNLSKNTRRYVENTNKKIVFFFSSSKINKYYFIILTIILLFSLGGPFWVEISSNTYLLLQHWNQYYR